MKYVWMVLAGTLLVLMGLPYVMPYVPCPENRVCFVEVP